MMNDRRRQYRQVLPIADDQTTRRNGSVCSSVRGVSKIFLIKKSVKKNCYWLYDKFTYYIHFFLNVFTTYSVSSKLTYINVFLLRIVLFYWSLLFSVIEFRAVDQVYCY